ncbi:cytochrome P450 [Phanerochaete sordida]|uniref:Cytochrome P450 n=1 Tax=Phanerochaete sordida TaxID=48140 RepID=A0A9P3G1J5_9APHY|nr:cytochrome P450 [Phanerochaete sordida]
MFSLSRYLDIALAVVAVVLVKAVIARRRQRAPYPPGPKGLPIIGNVLQMPKEQEWVTFARWGEQYGDIVYLELLGQPMVILNSAKDAVALLDKRGTIYSDRPVLTMGGELVGWKESVSLLPYGARFREYRKFMAKAIGSKAQVERYLPLVERETVRLLQRMLDHPKDVSSNLRKTAAAIILTFSHGYRIREEGDPLFKVVHEAVEQFFKAATPGAFLVDVFPSLRYLPSWFPGTSFKAKAKRWNETLQKMVDVPHEFVKEQMAINAEIPSFTSELLKTETLEGDKEHNIKWAAASLYSGGSDTTVAAIHTFILTMMLFPDAQRRAQAEIDSVVGNERLPTFADRSSMPFVEAVYKESLRWHSLGPLGLPHMLKEDDIYKGYLLPRGSIVIPNIGKFLHDPEMYPNPDVFDPTRFLEADGRLAAHDPRDFIFGFGRRICPGLHLADASVWAACAMILAVFDIDKPKGVDVALTYTSGTLSRPQFECSIQPRSAKARDLITASEERA